MAINFYTKSYENCMRVGILLTCGNHLHDHIISLRGSVKLISIVNPQGFS